MVRHRLHAAACVGPNSVTCMPVDLGLGLAFAVALCSPGTSLARNGDGGDLRDWSAAATAGYLRRLGPSHAEAVARDGVCVFRLH